MNTTIDCIRACLKKDGIVKMIAFGTWRVKTRKGRMGRNPKTGESLWIKPRKTVRFRAGVDLKKYVK